jgi:hypothetical protein
MKVQNLLLTIIAIMLTVICLQNAGLIPPLRPQDVKINGSVNAYIGNQVDVSVNAVGSVIVDGSIPVDIER